MHSTVDGRTVKCETAERLDKIISSSVMNAPSLASIQKLGNEGGAEAYPLARGDADNGYRAVSLYHVDSN